MFSFVRQTRSVVRLGNFFRNQRVFQPCSAAFFCTNPFPSGMNVAALTNGDKDLEHRLKVLILEIDVLRQDGKLVPDDEYLDENHWKELLSLPTISQRRKFLEFLFKVSKKKEHRQIKKEKKRELHEERMAQKPRKNENETLEEFVTQYDLAHNNIFLRFYDTTINHFYHNKLVQAMQFGQKLVIDCGYYENMTKAENQNCAKQLCFLFAENRIHNEPFDLHFCNVNQDSILMKALNKLIVTLYDRGFPLHLHENSYLDTFPKEQLVYLTPHTREELVDYDHDAIYIIGGIVDKVNTQPLSLAKAKREGIKMAKLPLDRYLQWGSGSGKSLTLNQVAAILLDAKHTGDWKHALRHVPKRKIIDFGAKQTFERKTWTPRKNNDFNNLRYNPKDRRVKISSIFNE